MDEDNEAVVLRLDPSEVTWIKGAIRQTLRKHTRGHRKLRTKLGAAYEPERYFAYLEFLEGLYRKLGGDPALITNYEQAIRIDGR